jgi:hypothetical protein
MVCIMKLKPIVFVILGIQRFKMFKLSYVHNEILFFSKITSYLTNLFIFQSCYVFFSLYKTHIFKIVFCVKKK